ncbi:MAG: hypothetical protein ABFS46_05395 [Myxococcota bacterium]
MHLDYLFFFRDGSDAAARLPRLRLREGPDPFGQRAQHDPDVAEAACGLRARCTPAASRGSAG